MKTRVHAIHAVKSVWYGTTPKVLHARQNEKGMAGAVRDMCAISEKDANELFLSK